MANKVRMSQQWIAKVREFEGLKLTKYDCPGGFATIGYGHLWKNGDKTAVSVAEAEIMLLADIAEAEKAVARLERKCGKLTQGQWDSLTDFVFNLGATKFESSTLYRQIVKDKDSPFVGDLLCKWVYASGKVLKGLVTRRNAEKARYYER